MDRLCPVPRGRTVKINLPPVNNALDVPAALAKVIEAVACGELSLDEAASLAALLKVQRETENDERAQAILGVARELTDEQLMAIIQNGGMRMPRPSPEAIRATLESGDY